MLTYRFLPYAVNLNTAGGTSAWINQIDDTSFEGGVKLFEETTGSETDRQFVAAQEIKPVLNLITSDLSILTTVGFAGVPIAPGSGTPGLTAYGRLLPLESLPAPIASADHLQMVCSDGLLVPTSLRAAHNQVAKLNLKLVAMLGSSGSSGAMPFVWSTDQAITSGAGATSNIYTTGPVKFTAGSSDLVAGISDINIDFGIEVLVEGDSGEVYPSHCSIIARMSKMEWTTRDASQIAAIGDGVSVSAFAAYFRKVAADGQRVAPATTSHISVSGSAGMITAGSTKFAHKKSGEASFTFTPTVNTQLLTISTAAAIPTS